MGSPTSNLDARDILIKNFSHQTIKQFGRKTFVSELQVGKLWCLVYWYTSIVDYVPNKFTSNVHSSTWTVLQHDGCRCSCCRRTCSTRHSGQQKARWASWSSARVCAAASSTRSRTSAPTGRTRKPHQHPRPHRSCSSTRAASRNACSSSASSTARTSALNWCLLFRSELSAVWGSHLVRWEQRTSGGVWLTFSQQPEAIKM